MTGKFTEYPYRMSKSNTKVKHLLLKKEIILNLL